MLQSKNRWFYLTTLLLGWVLYISPLMASEVTYKGIDVSEWQGNIDFTEVKNAGIELVYIRVAEGGNYEDPYWKSHYEGAKEAGLKIGFYHYMTALTDSEATTQAHYFYNLIQDYEVDALPVMDYESFSDLSNESINQVALTYLETLESLIHYTPVLYSDDSNVASLWYESLNQYPLWLAEYDVTSPETLGHWPDWSGFQYSDAGIIAGIDGNVDLDLFKSSLLVTSTATSNVHSDDTSTHSELNPNTPSQNLPSSSSTVATYTVESGNTLSQIALKFQVSVEALVSLNHIQNPNLIYPNQVLQIPTTASSPSKVASTTYTVQSGDTLWSIALRYQTTISHLVVLNNLSDPNLIYPGQILLI